MADIPYLVRNEYYLNPKERPELPSTGGGQGSFSFQDTKVYGPRQQRQYYTAYPVFRAYNNQFGDIRVENFPVSGRPMLIIPGTGGSAKAPGKRYFGSRAIGFNPNGLVLIRLIKIN